MRNLGPTMALIWYIWRIWPTVTDVLYDTMGHNLPHVVDHAPKLLLPGKISWVFPEATVFQCAPEPLVILSAFCMICDPFDASSHGLECRECVTRHLEAKVTGRNINFSTWPGNGLLNFRRRHDFSFAGRSITSLEEANWRQCRGIYIPWHSETFATCEER